MTSDRQACHHCSQYCVTKCAAPAVLAELVPQGEACHRGGWHSATNRAIPITSVDATPAIDVRKVGSSRWHRNLLLPSQSDAARTGLLFPIVMPRPYSFQKPRSARCQGCKWKATLSGLLQTPLEKSASGSPIWSGGLVPPRTHV